MRTPGLLLTTAAVVALVTSCGAPDVNDHSSAPSTGTPSSSAIAGATDPAPSASAGPEGTELQTAEQSGAWDLGLEAVRVAEHERFDRIVLEFAGTGTPGWAVHYVDEAVLDGSGHVVEIDGDAILQLDVAGTTWPEPEDGGTHERLEPEGEGAVVDVVHVGGSFEGYLQVFAGIDGGRDPFRVFALTDPSRLVVDVFRGDAD